MKEVNCKLGSKVSGAAYSVAAVCFVLLSLIVTAIAMGAGLKDSDDAYKYIAYLVAPAAIAAACAVTLKYFKVPVKATVSFKCSPKYYAAALLIIFGLMFSLSKINSIITDYVFVPLGYTPRESYLPSLDGGFIVLALIVIAVLPAFFEEYLFRGVILGGAEEGTGSVRGIFIAGFCFSLFHGSPEQTVYQFLCGCAFSLLAERSRSIAPCVFAHFLNNAFIIICSACGLVGADGNLAISQAADITLTVLGALALAGGILWLVLDKTTLKPCEKGGVKNFFIYASVGIAVLAAIWVASFF